MFVEVKKDRYVNVNNIVEVRRQGSTLYVEYTNYEREIPLYYNNEDESKDVLKKILRTPSLKTDM